MIYHQPTHSISLTSCNILAYMTKADVMPNIIYLKKNSLAIITLQLMLILKKLQIFLFFYPFEQQLENTFSCLRSATLHYATPESLTFESQSPGWGQGVNSQISSEDYPHTYRAKHQSHSDTQPVHRIPKQIHKFPFCEIKRHNTLLTSSGSLGC